MKFSFLTLFPELVMPYFSSSIMKRALERGLIQVECINIRDFADDKHHKVDGSIIGGGAGMLMDPFVLHRAIESVKEARVIFLTPSGVSFSSLDSRRLAHYNHLALVCGRYEGFDERSIEIDATEVMSVGDFIMTGGELAALCICDSIARQIKGVLGNEDSLRSESFESRMLEAPNFTKSKRMDREFSQFSPPKYLLEGNHGRIRRLGSKLSRMKTKYFRTDLYQRAGSSDEE